MFKAELHFGKTKRLMPINPGLALIENIKARDMYPFPVETRRQLSGAFTATMARGNARISEGAAQSVWHVAQSVSPWEPGGILARASWEINTGKNAAVASDMLLRVCSWCFEAWIIEAYRRGREGKKDMALAAIERAKSLRRRDMAVIEKAEQHIRSMK